MLAAILLAVVLTTGETEEKCSAYVQSLLNFLFALLKQVMSTAPPGPLNSVQEDIVYLTPTDSVNTLALDQSIPALPYKSQPNFSIF